MASRESILPAAVLRNSLCAEQRLSKRAATLLRIECDALATRLLTRAFASCGAQGGPLVAQDIWEALLTDPSCSWLVDRLGLWTSPSADDASSSLPRDVPLPLPPAGLTPDSDLLPRLVWLRANAGRAFSGAAALPRPLHDGLIEDDEDDAARPAKRARGAEPSALNPALFEPTESSSGADLTAARELREHLSREVL